MLLAWFGLFSKKEKAWRNKETTKKKKNHDWRKEFTKTILVFIVTPTTVRVRKVRHELRVGLQQVLLIIFDYHQQELVTTVLVFIKCFLFSFLFPFLFILFKNIWLLCLGRQVGQEAPRQVDGRVSVLARSQLQVWKTDSLCISIQHLIIHRR